MLELRKKILSYKAVMKWNIFLKNKRRGWANTSLFFSSSIRFLILEKRALGTI
jgi:hypothetical protein